jgi:hypothetical protein
MMLTHVSGVAGSLSDELLERYRTGQWIGPLPEPEQSPVGGVDGGDAEEGADSNSEGAGLQPMADDPEDATGASGDVTPGDRNGLQSDGQQD